MESKEPTQEKIIEAVKKYYGLKIDENAYMNADVYAYEETTADGYSVYVVTHDMASINVSEDVYYYDSGVAEAIMEMVNYSNGHATIYADQYFLDDIYFDDMLLESFQEVAEEVATKHNAVIEYIDMPAILKDNYQAYTCADMTKTNTSLGKI